MSEALLDTSPLDLGNGLIALFDEPTSGFYRVRMPNGEVQAFPSRAEPTRENAVADIVTSPVPPPPAPVPLEVSPWQIRRALNAAGLRAVVEAAVASADQNTRDGWDFATSVRRDNALLVGLATQLGLTSEQVDELFRAAAQVE